MNHKTGDILICRGKSWISKAIMIVTGGKFSHAAIVAQTWDQFGIIEAQKNGVNFKLWNTWVRAWSYEYVTFRRIVEFDEKEVMLRAFSVVGETKYDFFTFFRRAFGKRKKRSEAQERKKFICSEFCAWVWDIPNSHDITPNDLFVYLKNSGEWSEVKE